MTPVDGLLIGVVVAVLAGIVVYLVWRARQPPKWPMVIVVTPPGAAEALRVVAAVYGLTTVPNIICLGAVTVDEKARPAHYTNKGTPVQASLVPYSPQINVTAGFLGFTWATSGLAFAMWEYFEAFGAGQLGLPDTYSKSPARQDGTMQRKVAEAEAALAKAGL